MEQLGFNGAIEGVADALVDGRFDPAVCFAYLADRCHLPSHVIRYRELVEEALLMQLIDFSQGVDVGSGPIRSVQVPHIDLLRIQRLQRPLHILPQMFWPVCPLVFIHASPSSWVEFCVHDNAPLLSIELAQVLFRDTTTMAARCVYFVMAVGLENVKDLLRFTEVTDAGLLCPVADGHGAEDDINSECRMGCHSMCGKDDQRTSDDYMVIAAFEVGT